MLHLRKRGLVAKLGLVLCLGFAIQVAVAASPVADTPSPKDKTVRFLPPSARFPSGLDTTGDKSLPPTHGNAKKPKDNHLPVKPVQGNKVNAGHYLLSPLDENNPQ